MHRVGAESSWLDEAFYGVFRPRYWAKGTSGAEAFSRARFILISVKESRRNGMTTNEEFIKEIEGYSIEELELIYETQKDLYTEEEMLLIHKQIEMYEQKEKEKIEKLLPKELQCPKCEGPNSFENDECVFCGSKLDKTKYYDLDYYEKQNEELEELSGTQTKEGESNVFRYVVSFLIPLIGYILGAILLSKDSSDEKSAGKNCILLGISSTLLIINFFFL